MKFKWYDSLSKPWQEVVDQSLHFVAGYLLAIIHPLFSISVCLGREWWQNYGDDNNNAIDMLTDITVWTLGAIVMSLVS